MHIRTIKTIIKKAVPNPTDEQAVFIELLLDSWQDYFIAQKSLDDLGQVIKTNQRAFINPSFNAKKEAKKQIIKLNKLLGINPDKPQSNGDEWAGLLK